MVGSSSVLKRRLATALDPWFETRMVSRLRLCSVISRELKASNQSLLDRLLEIYRVHGVHASAQHSIKLPGASGRAEIEQMMTDLRAQPPELVGAYRVVKRIDYQEKQVWSDGTVTPFEESMPTSNVLGFYLEDGTRILEIHSGTYPKIKFYFESVVNISDDDALEAGESQAQQHLDDIMSSFLEQLMPTWHTIPTTRRRTEWLILTL